MLALGRIFPRSADRIFPGRRMGKTSREEVAWLTESLLASEIELHRLRGQRVQEQKRPLTDTAVQVEARQVF
jgi:hypothetical protein